MGSSFGVGVVNVRAFVHQKDTAAVRPCGSFCSVVAVRRRVRCGPKKKSAADRGGTRVVRRSKG